MGGDRVEIAQATLHQAEIDLARRQIAAFDEAKAQGKGVAVVDGKIVENLHVETARKTLDRAKAIAAMAG